MAHAPNPEQERINYLRVNVWMQDVGYLQIQIEHLGEVEGMLSLGPQTATVCQNLNFILDQLQDVVNQWNNGKTPAMFRLIWGMSDRISQQASRPELNTSLRGRQCRARLSVIAQNLRWFSIAQGAPENSDRIRFPVQQGGHEVMQERVIDMSRGEPHFGNFQDTLAEISRVEELCIEVIATDMEDYLRADHSPQTEEVIIAGGQLVNHLNTIIGDLLDEEHANIWNHMRVMSHQWDKIRRGVVRDPSRDPNQFPNSLAPIDQILVDVRTLVSRQYRRLRGGRQA